MEQFHLKPDEIQLTILEFLARVQYTVKKNLLMPNIVDSGNSKRLNSKQSLISKHFG